MRKGRKKSAGASKPEVAVEATFFRLCHLCLHLNESGKDIVRCQRCSSFLSADPLLRYGADGGDEDDEEMLLPADEEFIAPTDGMLGRAGGKRRRVTGLSVLW